MHPEFLRKTSLEDLGAATSKNFADHKVWSPSKVLRKSFKSPSEVLQNVIVYSFSTVVASVTHRQTNIWTSRAAVGAKKQFSLKDVADWEWSMLLVFSCIWRQWNACFETDLKIAIKISEIWFPFQLNIRQTLKNFILSDHKDFHASLQY